MRSGFLKYDSLTADRPFIRLHGDAAIVTGRADIQFRAQGQPRSEGLYYMAVGCPGRAVMPIGITAYPRSKLWYDLRELVPDPWMLALEGEPFERRYRAKLDRLVVRR